MMKKNAELLGEYLDLMDHQRDRVCQELAGLGETKIWQRPKPGEWSIGEILDHTRVINTSILPPLRLAWFLGHSFARLNQHKPYAIDIDDVFHRPGFPMHVGWIWSPKFTPKKPAPIQVVLQSLRDVHQKYRDFFSGKDPDLLGHVHIYDPVVGNLNLILVLRVGLFHDLLHYQDVKKLAAGFKLYTTPVA